MVGHPSLEISVRSLLASLPFLLLVHVCLFFTALVIEGDVVRTFVTVFSLYNEIISF